MRTLVAMVQNAQLFVAPGQYVYMRYMITVVFMYLCVGGYGIWGQGYLQGV